MMKVMNDDNVTKEVHFESLCILFTLGLEWYITLIKSAMSSHHHSNMLICLDHLHMPLFNVDSLQQRSMGNQIYGHMKASQCTPKKIASQWNIHHLKLYFLLILAMFQSHASFQGVKKSPSLSKLPTILFSGKEPCLLMEEIRRSPCKTPVVNNGINYRSLNWWFCRISEASAASTIIRLTTWDVKKTCK